MNEFLNHTSDTMMVLLLNPIFWWVGFNLITEKNVGFTLSSERLIAFGVTFVICIFGVFPTGNIEGGSIFPVILGAVFSSLVVSIFLFSKLWIKNKYIFMNYITSDEENSLDKISSEIEFNEFDINYLTKAKLLAKGSKEKVEAIYIKLRLINDKKSNKITRKYSSKGFGVQTGLMIFSILFMAGDLNPSPNENFASNVGHIVGATFNSDRIDMNFGGFLFLILWPYLIYPFTASTITKRI